MHLVSSSRHCRAARSRCTTELHVTVAGNTDERGSSEDNLALGQRRAQSVKSALGVRDAQVEAVGDGKEKPKAAGHDEAAGQQNRRADIAYQAS